MLRTESLRITPWIAAAKVIGIVAMALLISALGLPQWITGPLVNALLLLTVEWVGVSAAIVVGMITPLGAAVGGTLPLPLAVMIPFIAMGNAALVTAFGALRARGRWLALSVAAVAKFALLSVAVTWLVVRPLSVAVAGEPQLVALPAAMVEMMRWPQLATALAGGAIAWLTGALARHASR